MPDASGNQSFLRTRNPHLFNSASYKTPVVGICEVFDHKNESISQTVENSRSDTESLNQQLAKCIKNGRSLEYTIRQLREESTSQLTTAVRRGNGTERNLASIATLIGEIDKTFRVHIKVLRGTQRLWESHQKSLKEEREGLGQQLHIAETQLRSVINAATTVPPCSPPDKAETTTSKTPEEGQLPPKVGSEPHKNTKARLSQRRHSISSTTDLAAFYPSKTHYQTSVQELRSLKKELDTKPLPPLPPFRIKDTHNVPGIKARKVLGLETMQASQIPQVPAKASKSKYGFTTGLKRPICSSAPAFQQGFTKRYEAEERKYTPAIRNEEDRLCKIAAKRVSAERETLVGSGPGAAPNTCNGIDNYDHPYELQVRFKVPKSTQGYSSHSSGKVESRASAATEENSYRLDNKVTGPRYGAPFHSYSISESAPPSIFQNPVHPSGAKSHLFNNSATEAFQCHQPSNLHRSKEMPDLCSSEHSRDAKSINPGNELRKTNENIRPAQDEVKCEKKLYRQATMLCILGSGKVVRRSPTVRTNNALIWNDDERSFPPGTNSDNELTSGMLAEYRAKLSAEEASIRYSDEGATDPTTTAARSNVYARKVPCLPVIYSPTGPSHNNEPADFTVPHSLVSDAISKGMEGQNMLQSIQRQKVYTTTTANTSQFSGEGNESQPIAIRQDDVWHRRWVWLSPQERALLWAANRLSDENDTAPEPTCQATIESVLDVDDNDAYSKDKAPCHRFSRSILVLTPQGAFKFNALSAEGHFSWLVALSYVSQSCRDPGF